MKALNSAVSAKLKILNNSIDLISNFRGLTTKPTDGTMVAAPRKREVLAALNQMRDQFSHLASWNWMEDYYIMDNAMSVVSSFCRDNVQSPEFGGPVTNFLRSFADHLKGDQILMYVNELWTAVNDLMTALQ